jgi:hypothetical protein
MKVVRVFLWFLLFALVTGIAFWMITVPGAVKSPLLIFLVIVIFTIPPVGAFWMLYMAIRHEKHPLPMIILAFVPYAFLWYYFERFRLSKRTSVDRVID